MDDPQTQKLIERAREGNDDAWDQLFKLCQPHLLNDAQRLLGRKWHEISPRDLTQETWLKAKRRLNSYRGAGFTAWLGVIMRNVHRNLARGKRLRPDHSNAITGSQPQGEPIAADTSALRCLLDHEKASLVRQALAALEPKVREVLELWMKEQSLSLQEIARRLGLTARVTRGRFHRGVKELRQKLKELGE